MAIRMPHSVKPANTDKRAETFISGAGGLPRAPAPTEAEPDGSKTVVNMRFDTALLQRIDAAAKRIIPARPPMQSRERGSPMWKRESPLCLR